MISLSLQLLMLHIDCIQLKRSPAKIHTAISDVIFMMSKSILATTLNKTSTRLTNKGGELHI